MSSFIESQKSSFSKSLSSATGKLSKPQLAPPSPSPSVTSNTSKNETTPTGKRKRDANAPIYSQPEITGFGTDVLTQMTFAVEYLKKKDDARAVVDILDHLSLSRYSEKHRQLLVDTMRRHPRIEFLPDPSLSEQTWRTGTYRHRPIIPNVKDKTALLSFLQRKKDAQGVSVKDLKDGWPDCEGPLAELEAEKRVLVIRTRKDGLARHVFLDDPSLFHRIDVEFQSMWLKVPVPKPEDLPKKLTAVGQKPTSDDPSLMAKVVTPKANKPKKRSARKTGKTTNEHMEHLLKDYSQLKR